MVSISACVVTSADTLRFTWEHLYICAFFQTACRFRFSFKGRCMGSLYTRSCCSSSKHQFSFERTLDGALSVSESISIRNSDKCLGELKSRCALTEETELFSILFSVSTVSAQLASFYINAFFKVKISVCKSFNPRIEKYKQFKTIHIEKTVRKKTVWERWILKKSLRLKRYLCVFFSYKHISGSFFFFFHYCVHGSRITVPVLRGIIELDQPRIELLYQDSDDVYEKHKIDLLL